MLSHHDKDSVGKIERRLAQVKNRLERCRTEEIANRKKLCVWGIGSWTPHPFATPLIHTFLMRSLGLASVLKLS